MTKIAFLVAITLAVLGFPAIFYAQSSSMDKFKMRQQFDKFKEQIQSNAQQTTTQAQETVQERKVEAGQYQERQEASTEVFAKLAKQSQQAGISSTVQIYGLPILIIAAIGIILLVLWHQNL